MSGAGKLSPLVCGADDAHPPGGSSMKAHDGLYIDGGWRPAGRPGDLIEVVNPADEQVIARVPAAARTTWTPPCARPAPPCPAGRPPRPPSARPG
ncbi:protein of unknown function [Streptomyces murinus]